VIFWINRGIGNEKLTTKIGKQFGGYFLIKTDLVFSGYAFSRAAELSDNALQSSGENELFPNFEDDWKAARRIPACCRTIIRGATLSRFRRCEEILLAERTVGPELHDEETVKPIVAADLI
jgi:hypothetical protein